MTNTNNNTKLKDEELKNVSGGTPDTIRFEGHVGMYDGVIGERYFFAEDDGNDCIHGILLRSYEKQDGILFRTKRVHIVQEDWGTNQITQIYGDDWTIYKRAFWVSNGQEIIMEWY